MSSFVSVQNVYKTYKSKHDITHALAGVSLDIHAGEIISLLGVNGAGKTTLSSILATLCPPTSGDVLYNGVSIYHDIDGYRRLIGFCPQTPNLDKELTVRENLVFAGRFSLMSKRDAHKRADELIDQFDLHPYINFDVHALSGGYQQRLLIARSIVHKPRFLLLDEPTVGLDPDIRHNLWKIITQLKSEGMTIIITTHYLDEAEYLSDRVCILDRGRVVAHETLAGLRKTHDSQRLEDIFLRIVQRAKKEDLT